MRICTKIPELCLHKLINIGFALRIHLQTHQFGAGLKSWKLSLIPVPCWKVFSFSTSIFQKQSPPFPCYSSWQWRLLDFDSLIPLDLIKQADIFFCPNLAGSSHPILRVSTKAVVFGWVLQIWGKRCGERVWRNPNDYRIVMETCCLRAAGLPDVWSGTGLSLWAQKVIFFGEIFWYFDANWYRSFMFGWNMLWLKKNKQKIENSWILNTPLNKLDSFSTGTVRLWCHYALCSPHFWGEFWEGLGASKSDLMIVTSTWLIGCFFIGAHAQYGSVHHSDRYGKLSRHWQTAHKQAVVQLYTFESESESVLMSCTGLTYWLLLRVVKMEWLF